MHRNSLSICVECMLLLCVVLNFIIISCAARPLRDDEVLPVRQHRIVPSAAMATEEEEVSE